jgi:hypothetical protein
MRQHEFAATDGDLLCSICHHPEKDFNHMTKKQVVVKKVNPLNPSIEVLVALGSLAIHIEELLATPSVYQGKNLSKAIEGLSHSASFDLAAIQQNLSVEALRTWLADMDKMAFLPKKRN